MRNTVAKQLRRTCQRLNVTKAHYRRMKKLWSQYPKKMRVAVLSEWRVKLKEGGAK